MVQIEFNALFVVKEITDNFVLIVDTDEGRSVTNDACSVISRLEENIKGGLKNRKVYYRDSSGRFDELVHDGQGQFMKFAPCSEHQQKFFDSRSYNSH